MIAMTVLYLLRKYVVYRLSLQSICDTISSLTDRPTLLCLIEHEMMEAYSIVV